MKLLVLGCGSIGKRHVNNFSALADVGVYDQNPETVKDLSVTTFDRLSEALQWQADGVIVATPHVTHIDIAKQALQAGAHVLVEKPISHSIDGVSQLIEFANAKTKKLYVVCNMRFHSAVATMKENLARIGRPLFARVYFGEYLPNMRPTVDYRKLYAASRLQGGGVILDAIHEIDYLRWFFGDVESVIAAAKKLSELEIDVEDYASIQLCHHNGVQTEIHLDYLQRYKRRGCEIIGDQGTLIWSSVGKNPENCTVHLFSLKDNTWQTLYENHDEPANQAYERLAKQFTNAMSQSVDVLANGDDGLRALRIALAALESAKIGRRVELS